MAQTPSPDLAVCCDLCQAPTIHPRHLALCSDCFHDLVEQATARAADRRPLLTVAEAARLLGLSPQAVRRLIRQGAIEALNVAAAGDAHGNRYRISRKALKRFLSRGRRHRLLAAD